MSGGRKFAAGMVDLRRRNHILFAANAQARWWNSLIRVGNTRRCRFLRSSSDAHHAFAVGTDPGGPVTDSPFVLLETLRADLEAAGTIPAERFALLAAAAAILTKPSPSITSWSIGGTHAPRTSSQSQVRYASLTATISLAMISGTS